MKADVNKRIKKTLERNHACYVLITCDAPSESGEMQVEMTYSGDASIAAYLLEGAQSMIDEQNQFNHSHASPSKIQPLKAAK